MGKKNEVEVVVFDETKFGIKKKIPKAAIKIAPEPEISIRQENGDDLRDMQIEDMMERIKTSVDDLAMEKMSYKERRKFLIEKACGLAGQDVPKAHEPFNIRAGRLRKVKERAREQDRLIRETDAVIAKGQRLAKQLGRKRKK